ncbi:CHASE2 domain-containing protein [Anabaena sp. UHCC 0253]|uniref:CHASE2 domain-containing protein n=1 Tax=Anabaena sp. UHCC 0253 TaxID=2590019 RepID=UPI001444CCD6|nr:CHASE2 domain-containing protein [Anabaena sp. UHCC 0253]MTJ51926.1 CHASE2 domain-containing protein [Anabaena sp. UHCC 0253]
MMSQLKSKIDALLFNPQLSQAISRWSSKVLIVSVGMTVIVLGIRQLGGLQSLELQAFDYLVRQRPNEPEDKRLLIVGFTDEDINKKIPYPISDQKLAEILEKLQENEPAVIGVDIFRDIPIGEGKETLNKTFEEANTAIIMPCGMSDAGKNSGVQPPSSIPSEQVGFANKDPDPDAIIRRSILVSSPPSLDKPYPDKHLCNDPQQILSSFPFLISQYYFPEDTQIDPPTDTTPLKIGKAEFKRLESNAGGYQNLKTSDYQILLNYRSSQSPSRIVSISELLNNQVSPELIKNKVVLVGYTGSSFKDTFPTPYNRNSDTSGVVIHAQIISQIISAVEDNRPPQILYFPELGEWLWIGGWAVLGGLLTWPKLKPTGLVITAIVVMVGGLFVVCYAGLFFWAYWLPLIPSVLVLVGTSTTVLWIERIRIAPEMDWDGIREEETKKKGQAEKTARQEFLKQLAEKADELKREAIDFNMEEIQDSLPFERLKSSYMDNYLNKLALKAQQMRDNWRILTEKPFEQKKASIRTLVKKSQYLRSKFD